MRKNEGGLSANALFFGLVFFLIFWVLSSVFGLLFLCFFWQCFFVFPYFSLFVLFFLSLCFCFIIVVDFKLLCKRYPGFCKFFPLIFCITNNSQDSSGLTDLLEKGWEDPYRSLRERDLSLTLKLDEIRINPNEIELNWIIDFRFHSQFISLRRRRRRRRRLRLPLILSLRLKCLAWTRLVCLHFLGQIPN